ncbi:MAG: RNA 2',3'-cyclic phosphodiesterase, partial [Bdellovibrionota bacterium]
MSQNKRLFVAINVSDLMVSNFQPFLKKLKIGADQREIDLRWTVPENYHVTLSFIGNRNITEIPEFYSALEEAAKSFPAFNLKMEDVSAFPNETAGRVIYVGVQAKKILQNLKAKIDQELMAANLIAEVEDFTFIPHLTIARLRNPQH